MFQKPAALPIKDKLQQAGITQTLLAHSCGCSQAFLSQILNGYRPAPKWLAAKLNEAEQVINMKIRGFSEC